ncbi:hypothetical protein [Actinomadura alba]|uniref:Endonuclease/exonuclease/phosphatase domain-containing protein n=1 Tax=Actinomadura alba TaxID=406431 RepID=A0ABR7M227_9ACTN|nr:hypothetical protein [Actinomadura alba]MBC6471086.1 hypothetical protein [Actinomadura alba]
MTATAMWMPSIRARTAAGSSVARWNRAAERAAGVDAELAEPFGHAEGADGTAGLAAGEQPGRGSLVADDGVAMPGCDDLHGQGIERFGEHDGFVPQVQMYLVTAGLNVIDGETTHRRGRLGVEYVFDGQSGELDHVLAARNLSKFVSGASIWHINSDEPLILDYNTEFNPPGLYAPDAYRASDHDPVVIGLRLPGTP